MNQNFIVVLPVILVFAAALITRKVVFALFLGIVSASFIACDFAPLQSLTLLVQRIYEQTGIGDLIYQTGSYGKLYLFGFLTLLGILVELLTHAGGTRAFARMLVTRIKNARQTQLMTLFLSVFFFIDDSLNALMLGAIMRPLSDFYKIPRIKLAYLFNSVSSSWAVLIPASSWTGVIIAQLAASGVQKTLTPGTLVNVDPFYFLLCAIPFLIYPIMSIFAAWYVVRKNFSFGKMREQEELAQKTGDLFGGKACAYEPQSLDANASDGSILDIILPIATFMFTYLLVLLVSGGHHLFGGTKTVLQAFMTANNACASFIGALAAFSVAGAQFLIKKGSLKRLGLLAGQGILVMKRTLLMLLFAWTFSFFLEHDLNAGAYIAQKFLPLLTPTLAPVLVFIAATLMVIGIGSSWATIALLIPVVMPVMAHLVGQPPISPESLFLIIPTLGALLSGTVAGSQFSPITDATIIAALGAQCNHLDHVRTMASYALPTLVGATIAFVILGFAAQSMSPVVAGLISLVAGLLICVGLLHVRNRMQRS